MRSKGPARTLFAWYLATVVFLLALATALSLLGWAPAAPFLSATCVLVGLAWVVAAAFLAPNVTTFMAPGPNPFGVPPIVWPQDALPNRSAPVLANLGRKLSYETDPALAAAVLGFILFLSGIAVRVDLPVGALILLALAAAMAALLLMNRPIRSHARST